MKLIRNNLPEDISERLTFLSQKRWDTPDVEPIGWTVKEYELRERKKDPFIGILREEGVVIEEK